VGKLLAEKLTSFPVTPDARGIVEGEDVVEVLVGFAVEDVLADGTLDQ
jgi:hypothetical protein